MPAIKYLARGERLFPVHATEQLRMDNYHWLMTHCRDPRLGRLIARMLASQMMGEGVMPRWLGLEWHAFEKLMARCFPHLEIGNFGSYGEDVDWARADEHQDLRMLFLANANGDRQRAEWLADMLVAGCMGGDHLWQDMGLWSRDDLKALISLGFPELVARNIHDMKWKKFFYKQLCIQEGVYTCRAPSCQVCGEYQACFAPE